MPFKQHRNCRCHKFKGVQHIRFTSIMSGCICLFWYLHKHLQAQHPYKHLQAISCILQPISFKWRQEHLQSTMGFQDVLHSSITCQTSGWCPNFKFTAGISALKNSKEDEAVAVAVAGGCTWSSRSNSNKMVVARWRQVMAPVVAQWSRRSHVRDCYLGHPVVARWSFVGVSHGSERWSAENWRERTWAKVERLSAARGIDRGWIFVEGKKNDCSDFQRYRRDFPALDFGSAIRMMTWLVARHRQVSLCAWSVLLFRANNVTNKRDVLK